jgi:segregation and condensation protein B
MTETETNYIRMVEALLFASKAPLSPEAIATRLPEGVDVEALIAELAIHYEARGANLVCLGGKWQFRTSADLAFLMEDEIEEQRKLSRAGVETLAIIAYHQPVTRAEIEEVRGVSISKGTMDVLMEAGWMKPRGRRRTPGRPMTYGTTEGFLVHFGLADIRDLPGVNELKAAGLLDSVDVALDKLSLSMGVPNAGEDEGQLDIEEAIREKELEDGDEPSIDELGDEVADDELY